MRRLVSDLRIRNEVQFLSALSDADLSRRVGAQFSSALKVKSQILEGSIRSPEPSKPSVFVAPELSGQV